MNADNQSAHGFAALKESFRATLGFIQELNETMAIVIIYNTILLNKEMIPIRGNCDLDQFRNEAYRKNSTFYEDEHLMAGCSMYKFESFEKYLEKCGISPNDKSCVCYDAMDYQDLPEYPWIDHISWNGFRLAYRKDTPPGFMINLKCGWFYKFVLQQKCEQCSSLFTIEKATTAVDIREIESGPFSYMGHNEEAIFAVECANCGSTTTFDCWGTAVSDDSTT